MQVGGRGEQKKSKRMAQYHTTGNKVGRYLGTAVSMPTVWPARTWVSRYQGGGGVHLPACLPIIVGPDWESSTPVNLAVWVICT